MTECYTRPVRGAARLDGFTWPIEALRNEIDRIQDSDWKSLDYGERWSDVSLYLRGKNGAVQQHPLIADSPALQSVLHGFPSQVLDMCLASLEPGGSIKEHRDISGGVAAGVIRFHIPVTTHEDVAFYISGQRVQMGEGELWHLDTTYKHRVANNSDINRIHLIIDLEENEALRKMLPKADWRDFAHSIFFFGVCMTKGLKLLFTQPGQLIKRMSDLFRLRVLRQSVLYKSDDR